MELLTEDSALEGEICAAADYKDGVDNKISELEEAWIVGHPPVPVVSPSTSTSNSTAATSQPTINLPKVDLPKFHGDVLQYTSFWQQFEEIVDKKHNIKTICAAH